MRHGGWCRGTHDPGSPTGGATASSDPATPCPACCYPKTVPGMRGDPAVRGMCSGRSMRRPAPSSSRKKGPLSSWRGRQEVIRTQGRLSALSADRGAHSWYMEATGGNGDTSQLTQVPRAQQQRGLTLIPASSPEAWGRAARAVRTVPDRLPHERALAGLTARAAANRYLTEQILPQHNKRVRGWATEPGPACIAWASRPSPEAWVCKTSASWPRTIRCGIGARPCRSRKTRPISIM